MAHAIAEADGSDFQADLARYRRLAVATLKPLANPTDAMIDAAHDAVWFDALWAINSRSDFERTMKAMIAAALREHQTRRLTAAPSASAARLHFKPLWSPEPEG